MPGQRALLVIDVQRGFDDPALGPRDNPRAEKNVNLQDEFAEVVTTAGAWTLLD